MDAGDGYYTVTVADDAIPPGIVFKATTWWPCHEYICSWDRDDEIGIDNIVISVPDGFAVVACVSGN
jgi:hypothetical protein